MLPGDLYLEERSHLFKGSPTSGGRQSVVSHNPRAFDPQLRDSCARGSGKMRRHATLIATCVAAITHTAR